MIVLKDGGGTVAGKRPAAIPEEHRIDDSNSCKSHRCMLWQRSVEELKVLAMFKV